MRYEMVFAAAFAAGLLGAASQQSVAPPTRQVEAPAPIAGQAANPLVVSLAEAAAKSDATMGNASSLPMTAKQIAAEAKPAKPVKKVAQVKRAKPKTEVAAAPQAEPERHGWFYRLFHGAHEGESHMASAERD